MDGSAHSGHGGDIAVELAAHSGAEIVACHVYSSALHSQRFVDMEPGLPAKYQHGPDLDRLRGLHDSLIAEGFQALSQGYMDDLIRRAGLAGAKVRPLAVSGQNYVSILQAAERVGADLIVLGAQGLGANGDTLLGSTAARVMRHAACDVLLARGTLTRELDRKTELRPIIAGIDGSDEALAAARRAAQWAAAMHLPLELAAAYDPDFHNEVFRVMAGALTPQRQEQVGLAKQEDLHEDLINDGLARLYRDFLDAAGAEVRNEKAPQLSLLRGKAYAALVRRAQDAAAGLLVVARHGHHRQAMSLLGSNAEASAQRCGCNVLIVASTKKESQDTAIRTASAAEVGASPAAAPPAVQWDAGALRRLERIPSFARPMAQRAIEQAARDGGLGGVTEAVFEQVARRFGMGGGAGDA